VTEGPTLLPAIRSDKRTKEVFVLSPERMTGRSGLGIGGGMDEMDEGLSGEWMKRQRHCCRFGNSHCPESLFFIL
jgi:hypothetical protein